MIPRMLHHLPESTKIRGIHGKPGNSNGGGRPEVVIGTDMPLGWLTSQFPQGYRLIAESPRKISVMDQRLGHYSIDIPVHLRIPEATTDGGAGDISTVVGEPPKMEGEAGHPSSKIPRCTYCHDPIYGGAALMDAEALTKTYLHPGNTRLCAREYANEEYRDPAQFARFSVVLVRDIQGSKRPIHRSPLEIGGH